MPIIKCIECQKEYSSFAPVCPNCACPTELSINNIVSDAIKQIEPDSTDSKPKEQNQKPVVNQNIIINQPPIINQQAPATNQGYRAPQTQTQAMSYPRLIKRIAREKIQPKDVKIEEAPTDAIKEDNNTKSIPGNINIVTNIDQSEHITTTINNNAIKDVKEEKYITPKNVISEPIKDVTIPKEDEIVEKEAVKSNILNEDSNVKNEEFKKPEENLNLVKESLMRETILNAKNNNFYYVLSKLTLKDFVKSVADDLLQKEEVNYNIFDNLRFKNVTVKKCHIISYKIHSKGNYTCKLSNNEILKNNIDDTYNVLEFDKVTKDFIIKDNSNYKEVFKKLLSNFNPNTFIDFKENDLKEIEIEAVKQSEKDSAYNEVLNNVHEDILKSYENVNIESFSNEFNYEILNIDNYYLNYFTLSYKYNKKEYKCYALALDELMLYIESPNNAKKITKKNKRKKTGKFIFSIIISLYCIAIELAPLLGLFTLDILRIIVPIVAVLVFLISDSCSKKNNSTSYKEEQYKKFIKKSIRKIRG